MDAVLLAGGYATRLWPVTRDRPKMLLPLGDGTVIDRALTALENEPRVQTVYLSTNARFADAFERFLAERDYSKPVLTVEGTSDEREKPGVVGALAALVERESIDDELLVLAGDNVLGFDLSTFLDFYKSKGTPVLAAHDVGSRSLASSYGVVALDGTRVVEFEEKPDDPQSTLVSIACYALPRDAVALLDEYLASGGDPDEPGWFLQWLQERRPVHAFSFEEPWFDIGTAPSYLDALSWVLNGDVRVAPDATVEGSELGPNVHVLPDATVVDSTLSSTVVFPSSSVRDSTLRRSLVDRHADVSNVHLEESLVGQYSTLPGS